jgi:hypothetical protein
MRFEINRLWFPGFMLTGGGAGVCVSNFNHRSGRNRVDHVCNLVNEISAL